MRGDQKLIEMRLRRQRPGIVFLNDYPCDTDWFKNPSDAVTICTAGDAIAPLELRCLVGLTVSVSSPSEARAKALFEKCKASGAAVVAACHTQDDAPAWSQSGWTQVYRKTSEVAHG